MEHIAPLALLSGVIPLLFLGSAIEAWTESADQPVGSRLYSFVRFLGISLPAVVFLTSLAFGLLQGLALLISIWGNDAARDLAYLYPDGTPNEVSLLFEMLGDGSHEGWVVVLGDDYEPSTVRTFQALTVRPIAIGLVPLIALLLWALLSTLFEESKVR